MHNICIMKTKKCDVSSHGLLLIHPSFGYKINPQEENNPRVKHVQFGIIWEGKNILKQKMLEMENVRGAGCGKVWPLPIGRRHSASTCAVGQLHPPTLFICNIPQQDNSLFDCKSKYGRCEAHRRVDERVVRRPSSLRPRLLLWCDAVHWIPDT